MDHEILFDKLQELSLKHGESEVLMACLKTLYTVPYEKDKYLIDDEMSKILRDKLLGVIYD